VAPLPLTVLPFFVSGFVDLGGFVGDGVAGGWLFWDFVTCFEFLELFFFGVFFGP